MLRPIDLGNPVNRGASLNLGLAHWYRGLPNNRGTRTIFDLCKAANFSITDGTGYPAAMWSPKHGRCDFSPGGGVSPAYVATSDSSLADFSSTGITVSGWVFPVDVGTYNVVAGGTSTNFFYVGHYQYVLTMYPGSGYSVTQTVGPNLVQYAPTFAVWSVSASVGKVYADGVEVGSVSQTITPPGPLTWLLGNSGFGYGTNGGFGSLRFYQRILTNSEIVALYEEELAGCPTTLNRYTPRTMVFQGTSSAIAYTTSLSGSTSASGSLRSAVSKSLAGSSTASGSLAKSAAKPLAGESTAAASLARAIAKSTAGSCTATGAETHTASKALSGSATASGALANSAAKSASGSITATGAAASATTKGIAGSITASGSESNATAKAASGATTPTGGLAKSASISATGSTTPSGAKSHTTGKGLTGATTIAGSTSNAVSKAVGGSASLAGSLANAAGKSIAGSTTSSGAFAGVKSTLLAVSGAVTAAGSLVRSIAKYLVGLVTGGGWLATEGGTPAVEIDRPGGTFKRPPASRLFTRPPASRVLKRPATVASRIFSRRTGTARVFARHPTTAGRIFKGYPRMAAILITKLPIDTNETRAFIFDFSQFDEAKAGETLDSATVPAVSGVTIGTPAVLTEDTNFIPAGLGVKVNLSVAAAGTVEIECRGVFSGGSTCVVKGQLIGE